MPWGHWVVVPPVAQSLLPIPAGTVRGVWKRPVFSTADHGKLVTLTAGSITVDGEARLVQVARHGPPLLATDPRCSPAPSDAHGH